MLGAYSQFYRVLTRTLFASLSTVILGCIISSERGRTLDLILSVTPYGPSPAPPVLASSAFAMSPRTFSRRGGPASRRSLRPRYRRLGAIQAIRFHPTEKSVDVLRRLIEAYSQPGHLVLHPFAGVGSTLVAAALSDPRHLGVEVEARYVEHARRRSLLSNTPGFAVRVDSSEARSGAAAVVAAAPAFCRRSLADERVARTEMTVKVARPGSLERFSVHRLLRNLAPDPTSYPRVSGRRRYGQTQTARVAYCCRMCFPHRSHRACPSAL